MESGTLFEIGYDDSTIEGVRDFVRRLLAFGLSGNVECVVSFETETTKENILNRIQFQSLMPIMKFSIEEIESKLGNIEYEMVANLPYYITTPIIFKFLENATKLKSMTIMVQLEVAERLVATPGSKDYGAITPAIDYRANAKILKKVGRHMFTPVPNVDSAIVKIDFQDNKFDIDNRKVLDDTIKCVFAMRRKTIENNMKSYFKLSSEIINTIVAEAEIKAGTRGETLSTEQLVKLSNIINKYLTKK
jgi:16S rRNA (adenine1518-N6/adenine1519-N6)-dimethyltransferase